MKRQQRILGLKYAAIFFLIAASVETAAAEELDGKQPNIVVIFIDDI